MRLRQRTKKSYAVPELEDFDEDDSPVPIKVKRQRAESSDEVSVHEAEEEEEDEEEAEVKEEGEGEEKGDDGSGDDLEDDVTNGKTNEGTSPIRRVYSRPHEPEKEPEDPLTHPAYLTAVRKVTEALARLAVPDTFELRSANCPDKVVSKQASRKNSGTKKKENTGDASSEAGTPKTGRGRGRARGRGRGAAAEKSRGRGRGSGRGRGNGNGSVDQRVSPDADAPSASEEGIAALSINECIAALQVDTNTLMSDQPSDQTPLEGNRSSPKKAKVSAADFPELPNVIPIKMGEKGFSCPVGTCDRTVTYRQGIRVHILNNTHPLLEFLIWAYPDEPAYDADADAQTEAERQSTSDASYTYQSLQQLVSSIPPEALPMKITKFSLLYEGFPRPSKLPIVFDAPEKIASAVPPSAFLNEIVNDREGDFAVDDDAPPQGKRRRKTTGDRRVVEAKAASDWGEQILGPRRDAMRNEGTPVLVGDPPYLFVRPFLEDFDIVSRAEAEPYLPKTREPVNVILSRSKSKNADPEDAVKLAQFELHALPNAKRKGFVINAGCSIWGLDWCPTSKKSEKNYLALGGYSGAHEEHHPVGASDQSGVKGCVQIWEVGDAVKDNGSKRTDDPVPRLVLCLLHEFGCIWEMKWCPLGARDLGSPGGMLPKIGLLAICFGDGTLKVIAVPCPDALQKSSGDSILEGETLYARILRPIQTLSIPDTAIWTVGWGGHTKIAAGCANGNIAIWDIENALNSMHRSSNEGNDNPPANFLSHYFHAHDACVRSVDWCSHDDPMVLSSVGMDGRFIIFDIRDPFMPLQMQRIRGFMFSTCWPKHYPGLAYTDADNGVRHLLVAQLGRTYGLMVSHGLIWSITSSNYHPFIATASADGRLAIGNIHRHRRRNRKPVQQVIYQLCWDSDTMTYSYIDDFKPEDVAVVYHTPENLFNMFFPEQAQLQRCGWSGDVTSGSWVAAGGSAGLVRLEATYDK